MRKFALCALIGALVLGGALPALADYPEMTIRLSHNQPVGSPEDLGAQKFKELVEERSGGKMTVEIFPQGQMGSMREQTEMVQMGTLEITIQPTAVLTPFVEQIQIVDFPFLWPSREAIYDVMDGELGERFYSYFEARGLKSLGLWSGGFKQITNNVHPITGPDDFKGMTVRVMPSPLLISQYKAWGANPVPIEYSELYNALQQGIVDGEENPLQSIALGRFYEVQDYLTLSDHGFFAYLFVANNRWFKRLPDDARALIVEAEREARTLERMKQAEDEAQYLDQIKQSKIAVNTMTQEQRQAFAERSRAVHEEFAATSEMKELLHAVYEAIEVQR